MEESPVTEQLELSDFYLNPQPGKFYVVLGDSIEGNVKCLSCSDGNFQAKYLAICSQNETNSKLMLRETR